MGPGLNHTQTAMGISHTEPVFVSPKKRNKRQKQSEEPPQNKKTKEQQKDQEKKAKRSKIGGALDALEANCSAVKLLRWLPPDAQSPAFQLPD